jgi:chromosome segregation ATPase
MTQTSSSPVINHPVTSAKQPQSVETTPSTTPADPLSDLSATIASMKEHLDELQASLVEAGRKLREATIQQKQKERTYQDTQKRLERIRLAV